MGSPCPCGRAVAYERCCGPLHSGAEQAVTAEQLMRSRYSAFAVGDADYLARSWATGTRPRRVRVLPDQRWIGLEVLATEAGGMLDATGIVEFRASFERDGEADSIHERSAFTREGGRWVYVGPA